MDRPRGVARLRALLGLNSVATSSRRNMVMLLSATAIAQGIALLVSPLLTRLTSPTAFGVFGVYLAVLGVLGAATSWRSGLAVPLPETDEDAAAVVAAGIVGSIALAAVAAVIVLFSRDWLATVVLDTPAIAPLLWLVPIGMLGVGLTDVLSGWCLRHRNFKPLVRSRISRSVGTSVSQVAGGMLVRGSPIGLVAGDVIGRLISVGEMARALLRGERGRPLLPSLPRIRSVTSRYRNFALISTPSTIINAAGAWAPVLLLTIWWGPVAGGLYTIGQRVIGVPIGLLGDSAGQVFIGELAARRRMAPAGMMALFTRTATGLLAIGLPAGVALLLLAPVAFRAAFGAQWADAGVMVQWQAIALVFQLVAIPLAQTLNVLGHQRDQFAWDVFRLVVTVGAFALAHRAGLDAVKAVAVFGAIAAVTYLLLIALGWRAVKDTAARARAGDAGPSIKALDDSII